jgi:hypothetical protein
MRGLRIPVLAAFLLSAILITASAAATVAAPDSTIEGRTLPQWSAEWWKSVFAIPVYAADGTTVIHPQFDAGLNPGDVVDAPHGLPSPDGRVFFLYGSFSGGDLERTVTVPAGKHVFVPIVNTEWSNPDTAPPPNFVSPPGNYTQAELAAFAKTQGDTITGISASLDGQAIGEVLQNRHAAQFEYTQPPERSITQTFFGIDAPGPNESAADGYYLMFLPLEEGEHTLTFTGSSPDNSATPPLLGAFDFTMTYHLNVVGAAAIPLPAGVWLGLSALSASIVPALRARWHTRGG